MRLTTSIFVFLVAAAHAGPAPVPKEVWSAISVSRPIFILGREEIDVFFSAINDTDKPVLYEDIRGGGVLIVNGEELKDSGLLFGNGPRETTKFLNPGKATLFVARLTNYFAKPGNYEVAWKGKQFGTKPVVFRIVEKY